MKFLGQYWKALLALMILVAAAVFYFQVYEVEAAAFEKESAQLKNYISALESNIKENMRYQDVQDKLEEATAKVDASRLALYEHFPLELKQEDQILYILYLERLFGTEIQFAFSEAQPLVGLRDGATLMGMQMTVNYETTYEGFQDMVDYLASDSRITSVVTATIEYDAEQDVAKGHITLLLYLMKSDLLEYVPPYIEAPETGKENIFE